MNNSKYTFYARHEALKEPITGEMYAGRWSEVRTWIKNRVAELSGIQVEDLKPFKTLKHKRTSD
jgi:hypothetical protein